MKRDAAGGDRPVQSAWRSLETAGLLGVATLMLVALLGMSAAAVDIDIPDV